MAETILQVTETNDDEHYTHHHCIPISAFGAWHVLLGSKTHAETMRAVIYVQDHQEPDSAWVSAYNELAGRDDNGIATTREALGLPAAGYVKGLPQLDDDAKAMLEEHKDEIESAIADFEKQYELKG